MKYRQLGSTGLKVSELCLGTMTFGKKFYSIGSLSAKESEEIIREALASGVNFFDTANVYSLGESETILGNALKSAKIPRESFVIATKVRGRMGDGPNEVGLSRGHILDSVEQSLKRLQVDYIDLYQVHSWDPITPIEETMQALNDLVRWGKVRYIGVSNYMAWQVVKANYIAKSHGWSRFVTLQAYYSLVGRDIENDLVPMCQDQNMGILPWSPLAGGWLSGKYRRDKPFPKDTRFAGDESNSFLGVDKDKLYRILDVLDRISAARKVPVAAVALAWLKSRPMVSSVIIGARNIEQLRDNVKASEIELAGDEISELDKVSADRIPYPQWMIARQAANR